MQLQLRCQRASAASRQSSGRRLTVCVRADGKLQCTARRAAEQIAAKVQLPALARPALLAAISSAFATLPAHAEAGKIFDFNLTLPIMVAEFLLLMVFLDKTWFGPVGKVLDERDKLLRDKLGSVKDNSSDLEKLQKEAEEAIASARSYAADVIQKAKKETEAEIQAAVNENKQKLDRELEQALATLEKEQQSALGDVDAKVDKLVQEVMSRVLPEGVNA